MKSANIEYPISTIIMDDKVIGSYIVNPFTGTEAVLSAKETRVYQRTLRAQDENDQNIHGRCLEYFLRKRPDIYIEMFD